MTKLKYFIATALLFCPQLAQAETLIKYYINAGPSISSVKGLSLGKQEKLLFLETKWEGGLIYDTRPSAKAMGFLSGSLGVEPKAGPLYVNFFQGVGLVSTSDAYLSGLFQFFIEAGAGVADVDTGIKLGVHCKHISNAGISLPNRGKDMCGIQIGIPL